MLTVKVTEQELNDLFTQTFGSVPGSLSMDAKVQAVVLTHGMEKVIHMTRELRNGQSHQPAER